MPGSSDPRRCDRYAYADRKIVNRSNATARIGRGFARLRLRCTRAADRGAQRCASHQSHELTSSTHASIVVGRRNLRIHRCGIAGMHFCISGYSHRDDARLGRFPVLPRGRPAPDDVRSGARAPRRPTNRRPAHRRLRAPARRAAVRSFRNGLGAVACRSGILSNAEEMEAQAITAENQASGRDVGLEGDVRITASEWMIATMLAPRLKPFLARHPALSIDLVAEARHLNLFRREADVALRLFEFPAARNRPAWDSRDRVRLYASSDYLARMARRILPRKARATALVTAGAGMGNTIVYVAWLPPLVGRARVASRIRTGRLWAWPPWPPRESGLPACRGLSVMRRQVCG